MRTCEMLVFLFTCYPMFHAVASQQQEHHHHRQHLIHQCQEPTNRLLAIASALFDLYTDHWYGNFSLNIVKCFQDQFTSISDPIIRDSQQDMQIQDADSQQNSVHSECSCNIPEYDGPVESTRGDFERAYCRWDFVIDYNENRIPSRLATAVVQSLRCRRGSCQPIKSYVPVLIKQCNEITGVYEYHKAIEEVAIGYGCVLGSRAGVYRHVTAKMQV